MAKKKPENDKLQGGFFSKLFNARISGLSEIKRRQLEHDMVRAFWEWDNMTIKALEKKGAPYTHEMLEIAVLKHRDRGLVRDCLNAGVIPRESLLLDTISASRKNGLTRPILGDLLEKSVITKKVSERLGVLPENIVTSKVTIALATLN